MTPKTDMTPLSFWLTTSVAAVIWHFIRFQIWQHKNIDELITIILITGYCMIVVSRGIITP